MPSRFCCLILFSCLFLRLAHAQSAKDYTQYHEQILQIEALTAGEQFAEALDLYSQLFSQFEHVFAKDAYNACMLAAWRKDQHFAEFFEVCARSGIELSRLQRNSSISPAYRADADHLQAIYKKGRILYLQRIDPALQKEWKERYTREQSHKSGSGYADICRDNFLRVVELAKAGRFPGEDLIGNQEDFDSYVLPTLLHYPYAYRELENELWEAVRAGKMTPFAVLYLYSFNQTRTSVLYRGIPEDKEHFNIYYNLPLGKVSTDLEEVDRQRRARQITSLAVRQKLQQLATKHRLDYLWGY